MKEYLGKQHGKFQTFKTKQAETKQKEEAKQQKLEDKAKADESAPIYPFSEENVREFAIFCEESGGFEIC